MRKEVIEKYVQKKGVGHDFTLKDFYRMYCYLEQDEGRTPLDYYQYRACFYKYFYYMWQILIRCKLVYTLLFGLGTIKVRASKGKKRRFVIYWRKKENKKREGECDPKIGNQTYYKYRPIQEQLLFGREALRVWVKETRHQLDIRAYDAI